MRKPRSALALLLLLGLGVSLTAPAEDVPETAYDESEALPYESIPVFSIGAPLANAPTNQVVPTSIHHKLGAQSAFPFARIHDIDAHRPANARSSLALLCTLLC